MSVQKFNYKRILVLSLVVAVVAAGVSTFTTTSRASGSRDCDDNAVIYCGTLSTTELKNKLDDGTGKQYQSSAELKSLFAHYGIQESQFGKLVDGYVTKDNKVYVDGKVVKNDVYSIGRHYIPGSTKLEFVKYPLYQRHPSVSFVSNTIGAFVYLNYDNSMAYAVLKSCGNIVPGVGIRTEVKKYDLTIKKFEDLNGNGQKEATESYLADWKFRVTGKNYDKTINTDAAGIASFKSLPGGDYKITEIKKDGWISITNPVRDVHLTSSQTIYFGNKKIVPGVVDLRIIKFNDVNGNKVKDENEVGLSGWQFKVNGPSGERTVATDETGQSLLTGQKPGEYTVTEVAQSGWKNTTGLAVKKTVTTDAKTQEFDFGNRQIVPGQPSSLPVSGPASAAAGAFSITALIGAAYEWLKSKKLLFFAKRKK